MNLIFYCITSFVFVFNPAFLALYMVFFLFLTGATYSILHVFTKRRKSEFEKFSMVYFAAFANGASGIFAGLVMLKDSNGILMIFPAWNMLNGFITILAYKLILYDEGGDLDTNANPLEIVIGSVVVFVTFAICHFVFLMHWALCFSICITYSSNIDGILRNFIERRLGRKSIS